MRQRNTTRRYSPTPTDHSRVVMTQSEVSKTEQDGARVGPLSDPRLVYFSSATENTARFVKRLGIPAERIPLRPKDGLLSVDYDYVLVVPTYGGGNLGGAVPKQVIKFLNDETNRSHCKGVISAGNTNFGKAYCIAGDIVSKKVGVPHLYKFELLGTPEDVSRVQEGLRRYWSTI